MPVSLDLFTKTFDDLKNAYAAAKGPPSSMDEKLSAATLAADVAFRTELIAVLRKIDGNLVELSNSSKASNQNFMEKLLPPMREALEGLTRFLPPAPFMQDGKEFPGMQSKWLEEWPPVAAVRGVAKAFDHYITHVKK
jgi:hypothetical protein